MFVTDFKDKLGLVYKNESFIIQQKAFVLFWLYITTISVYLVVNVINLTTTASTHPLFITLINVANMIFNCVGLYILLKGKYNASVLVLTISILSRVVTGVLVKFDLFVQSGFNNNIYFTFVASYFVALLAARLLIHFIMIFLLAFNVAIAIVAVKIYHSPVASYLAGSTINLVIAIIAAYVTSILMSIITERSLSRTEEELSRNKDLSASLETKVQELQAMYEEMETMNEELEENSQEIMDANRELNMFRDFAETSTQGFVMTDLDGLALYINAAMKKIVGLEKEETILGIDVKKYFPEEYRDKLISDIIPYIRKHKSWSGEIPLVMDTGGLVSTLHNIFLLRDGRRRAVAFANVITDLTERKALEAQLLQSQKMEAVGRLAGGVAHDFNNYLTAITGYSSLLTNQMDQHDSRLEYVEEILRAAEKSSSLTRQLLTISKRQMLHPVLLNINFEVNDLKRMLSRIIGENIELVTRLEESLWSVRIDPVQVEQIILNLVVNARDAMPDGGKLIIGTENKQLTSLDCMAIENGRPGDFVCLSVRDTGQGINDEFRENIFEPFFTTKESGKGTGLGLSVIYAIAQQQEGWINVSSEKGRGTEFRIFFPAILESAAQYNMNRKPVEELSGRGERILIVEDKDEVRRFTVTALSQYGYVTSEASCVGDAVRVLEAKKGEIDIVLSDIKLPDGNGIELVQRMERENPGIPFLLCSGFMEKESLWDVIVERQYPYLPKPYTLYELLEALRGVIESRPN